MAGDLPEFIARETKPARCIDALCVELGDILSVVDRFPLRMAGSIGEGQSGCVRLALDEIDGKVVAVKVLGGRVLDEPVSRERSVRELRALHFLRGHPNIVHVFHSFAYAGRIFVVTAYEEHGEIFDLVVEHGPLREDIAAYLFRQMVIGVQHCHRNGIVHRDIKPENALLGRDFSVRLCDFGFCNFLPGSPLDQHTSTDWSTQASRRHRQMLNGGAAAVVAGAKGGSEEKLPTVDGSDGGGSGGGGGAPADIAAQEMERRLAERSISTPCGSPSYAAPEVFLAQPYDERADVWSLGVNLYVMVTGSSPWGAVSVRHQKSRIQRGRYEDIPADIDPFCASLIRALIVVNPADRPTLQQVLDHPYLQNAKAIPPALQRLGTPSKEALRPFFPGRPISSGSSSGDQLQQQQQQRSERRQQSQAQQAQAQAQRRTSPNQEPTIAVRNRGSTPTRRRRASIITPDIPTPLNLGTESELTHPRLASARSSRCSSRLSQTSVAGEEVDEDPGTPSPPAAVPRRPVLRNTSVSVPRRLSATNMLSIEVPPSTAHRRHSGSPESTSDGSGGAGASVGYVSGTGSDPQRVRATNSKQSVGSNNGSENGVGEGGRNARARRGLSTDDAMLTSRVSGGERHRSHVSPALGVVRETDDEEESSSEEDDSASAAPATPASPAALAAPATGHPSSSPARPSRHRAKSPPPVRVQSPQITEMMIRIASVATLVESDGEDDDDDDDESESNETPHRHLAPAPSTPASERVPSNGVRPQRERKILAAASAVAIEKSMSVQEPGQAVRASGSGGSGGPAGRPVRSRSERVSVVPAEDALRSPGASSTSGKQNVGRSPAAPLQQSRLGSSDHALPQIDTRRGHQHASPMRTLKPIQGPSSGDQQHLLDVSPNITQSSSWSPATEGPFASHGHIVPESQQHTPLRSRRGSSNSSHNLSPHPSPPMNRVRPKRLSAAHRTKGASDGVLSMRNTQPRFLPALSAINEPGGSVGSSSQSSSHAGSGVGLQQYHSLGNSHGQSHQGHGHGGHGTGAASVRTSTSLGSAGITGAGAGSQFPSPSGLGPGSLLRAQLLSSSGPSGVGGSGGGNGSSPGGSVAGRHDRRGGGGSPLMHAVSPGSTPPMSPVVLEPIRGRSGHGATVEERVVAVGGRSRAISNIDALDDRSSWSSSGSRGPTSPVNIDNAKQRHHPSGFGLPSTSAQSPKGRESWVWP